jgi:bacteriocin biosynthesis cyclodehydratase domain-containing protein
VTSPSVGAPNEKSGFGSIKALLMGSGPILPPLAVALAQLGIGRLTLLGSTVIDPVLVQQSRYFEQREIGGIATRVLAEKLNLDASKLRVRDLPKSIPEWRTEISDSTIGIALVEGPVIFPAWLAELNQAAHELRLPWVTAAQTGPLELLFGPFVVPGSTACYHCYDARNKSSQRTARYYFELERFLAAKVAEGGRPEDFGMLPPFAEILADFLVLELERAMDPTERPLSLGKVITIDPRTLAVGDHPVMPLPHCPVCGSGSHREDTPRGPGPEPRS